MPLQVYGICKGFTQITFYTFWDKHRKKVQNENIINTKKKGWFPYKVDIGVSLSPSVSLFVSLSFSLTVNGFRATISINLLYSSNK